ncbi:MAG TPA: hypothetical protein VGR35_11990 [Tepidisphaeraceae bacterium]|nr:hypothetical protein [Tepidisphaeraceae bacterium]
MTPDRIRELFKIIGKLIRLGEIGAAAASGVKDHLVAVQEQFAAASGSKDPYGEMSSFLVPTLTNSRPPTQGMDRLTTIARSGADLYLSAVAAELGLPANSPAASVMAAIKTAMQAHAQQVPPSGAFYTFALTGYAVQLPQGNPPTIDDGWITTVIV